MKKKMFASVIAAVIFLTGCGESKENYENKENYSAPAPAVDYSAFNSALNEGLELPETVEQSKPESSVSDDSGIKYPDIVYTPRQDDASSVPATSSSNTETSEIKPSGIICTIDRDKISNPGTAQSSSSSPNTPKAPTTVTVSNSASDIKKICGLKSKVETDVGACIVDTYNDHNPYDVAYDYGKNYNAFVDACDWSLVFDANFYAESFPLLAMQYHDDKSLLLEHFQTVGIHEGRQGNKSFNVGVYKANCKSDVKNAFGDNYEGYYFYYMLNYASEKSAKTAPSSSSKLQQKTIMTALQAAELKGVNMYRKEVGVVEIKFDEELAAYANYRAYLNSHDGWKAHDWFRADDVVTTYIMNLYDAAYMSENTTTRTCNESNCTSHKCNYGETRYEDYRASKSHYEAMIAAKYDLIGTGNCYKASNVISQFDAFIDL